MERDEGHSPLAEATTTDYRLRKSRNVELLEFLFQQRLCLFNTRRDHEWKIFFGVMSILGSVDYTLLNWPLLRTSAVYWWPASVFVLLVASGCFQYGVQSRNHADRLAMDAITREIREEINIRDAQGLENISCGVDCSVRQKTYADMWHITYIWAFCCEMVVLIVASGLSMALPFVLNYYLHKTK